MATTLSAVVVEARDVRGLARFWAEALRWQDPGGAGEPGRGEGGEVVVRPAGPGGVALVFVPSDQPKAGKNRLHLDLAAGPDPAAEVRRLLALGAVPADIGQGDVAWDVLADPEGNEFCVLPPGHADHVDDAGLGLAAICQDAADPDVQRRFWAAATGWTVAAEGDWGFVLRAAAGTGPALVMGPPASRKKGRNRWSLRLAPTPDGQGGQAAETARLLAEGASSIPGGDGESGTLADPEGNEFGVADAWEGEGAANPGPAH
jgi:hypothetical protein